MVHKVTDVKVREIIDCRGFPTVEVDVWVAHELFKPSAIIKKIVLKCNEWK